MKQCYDVINNDLISIIVSDFSKKSFEELITIYKIFVAILGVFYKDLHEKQKIVQ